MASKSSFFSKFIAFFLVLIIISGVGFLGYNLVIKKSGLNMSMGMNMIMPSQSAQSNSTKDGNTEKSSDSSKQDQVNMRDNSYQQNQMNMNNNNSNNQSNTEYAANQVNTTLQNKEALEKNLSILNDALKLMTLDPYGVDVKNPSQDNANNAIGQVDNNKKDNGTSAANTQGGTIVNVYPQGNGQGNTMQGMGTTYDPNKMQQLHNGLYKISVGMQLLNQLKDNAALQVEQASMEVKNSSQYYQNQYLMTVQNKNKLLEALTYINEASTLLNINPYVSQNGSVYDKERMTQIHQSVYKLAEAVGGLNKLNDDFTKQTMSLGNLSQNSMNMSQMNQQTNNSFLSSIFGTINMATLANVLLIVFIITFIMGIIGYIGRLLKPSK